MNNTYEDIKSGRRLTWAGIAVGAIAALAVGIVNLRSDEGSVPSAIAFLVVLALPSTLGYLSLDRRPSLLGAAAMSGVLLGVITLSGGIGFVLLISSLLWAMAIRKRRRGFPEPGRGSLMRVGLAALTVLPLIALVAHLDPICTVIDADGTVIERRVDESAPSGWRLSPGSTSSGFSLTSEETTETCSSNVIEPWEAGLSVLVSLSIAALALRWPTNDRLVQGSPEVEKTSV